jgi:hypothetical protein
MLVDLVDGRVLFVDIEFKFSRSNPDLSYRFDVRVHALKPPFTHLGQHLVQQWPLALAMHP